MIANVHKNILCKNCKILLTLTQIVLYWWYIYTREYLYVKGGFNPRYVQFHMYTKIYL